MKFTTSASAADGAAVADGANTTTEAVSCQLLMTHRYITVKQIWHLDNL